MSRNSSYVNLNKILLLIFMNIIYITCDCAEGKIQIDSMGTCAFIPSLMKRGVKFTTEQLDYLSNNYKGTKLGKFIVTVHKLPNSSEERTVIPKDKNDISVVEIEEDCLSTLISEIRKRNMNKSIYFFLIENIRETGFENSYINSVKYFLKEPDNKEVILQNDKIFKECKSNPMRIKYFIDFRKAEGYFQYIKYGEDKRNLAVNENQVTVINMNDVIYAKEEYNVDFFDLTSEFYTDICFKYETDNGANLPLNLRKQLYNMNCSFCGNNGEETYYEGFEYDKQNDKLYAKCLFYNTGSETQMQNKLDQIDQTLNKVIKRSNFNVVKCSQHVFDFSIETIFKNYGEIICTVCILLQIIFLLCFIIAGTTNLREIVFGFINKAEDKQIEEIYGHRVAIETNQINSTKSNNEFLYSSKETKRKIKANPPPRKHSDKSSDVSEQIFELNDEEMDQLSLENAIKHDTRGFCSTYCYYLKKSQLIWFTFFNCDDYNSFVVKLSLFIFQFPMLLAINAFFYTEEDLSAINLDIENLDFHLNKDNILRALISSIIGFIILFILKGLCLSHSGVESIRHEKNIEAAREMAEDYFFYLRCKIFVYFVISTCLLLAFWYFITAFCAIFPAVFPSLVYDTIISLAISLLYPFAVCWFAAFCRKLGMCCNCCLCYCIGKLLACF